MSVIVVFTPTSEMTRASSNSSQKSSSMFERLNIPESRLRHAEPVFSELSVVFSFFLNTPNSVGSSFLLCEPDLRADYVVFGLVVLRSANARLAALRSASIFLVPVPVAIDFESITTSIVNTRSPGAPDSDSS